MIRTESEQWRVKTEPIAVGLRHIASLPLHIAPPPPPARWLNG